jgi:hypothetical protein
MAVSETTREHARTMSTAASQLSLVEMLGLDRHYLRAGDPFL